MENPKESTKKKQNKTKQKNKKKPFYVTNKFNKILWYKIDTQELIIFLYIAMNLWTPKLKLQYHLQLLKNWTT